MFVNDIEETFIQQGVSGIDLNTLKMFLILYADDIVLFADNAEDLQHNLNVLYEYLQKWKLNVNVNVIYLMKRLFLHSVKPIYTMALYNIAKKAQLYINKPAINNDYNIKTIQL